jgi:hypothetical protein
MALVILAFIDPQLLRIPPKAYFFVAFVIGFDNSYVKDRIFSILHMLFY